MRLLKVLNVFFVLMFICMQNSAYAALELVLTQGIDSALPIAVVPFAGQDNSSSNDNVSAVINADLRNSGRFRTMAVGAMSAKPHTAGEVNPAIWQKAGVDSVVVGSVEPVGNQYKVNFALVDVFKGRASEGGSHILASQSFTVNANQLRSISHHIADIIYEKLTGVKGIFSTRIAYILVQRKPGVRPQYKLEIADADGFNPRSILISREPIMSPAWSHDGKALAYVSFENRRAQVYISRIATGERKLVSSYPGINGAPSWSPDDRSLAVVLSKDGTPKIYTIDLAGGTARQVTTGRSIDTEPTWSPDGRVIVFTSDRGGSPQLYRVSPTGGDLQRVTYNGQYNARASFTPDGKKIVMLHRVDGMYNIAVQDLSTGNVQILTRSGRDESPSVSANGYMILYGSEYGELGLVSIDGRINLRLPARDGSVQGPAWSPFLN